MLSLGPFRVYSLGCFPLLFEDVEFRVSGSAGKALLLFL